MRCVVLDLYLIHLAFCGIILLMNIETFPVGLMQANCYLVFDDRQCLVIDPGAADSYYLNPIFAYIDARELHVLGVLLTHAHFDHIAGADEFTARYSCPVYLHECDVHLATNPQLNLSASLLRSPFSVNSPIEELEDGEILFEDTELCCEVIYTPGHTPGGCCYKFSDSVFTGDTLFAGSVGRTDFPGGDFDTLLKSLNYLRERCTSTPMTAYPGHGEPTALPREFETNIYYKRG